MNDLPLTEANKMTEPPPPPSLVLRHMPSLDSIRGAAILLVLMFHGFGSYVWTPMLGPFWGSLAAGVIGSGRFGVNVFFVLSGFLITTLLFKARERPDFYKDFYIRRVLRILPVYLLVLAIVWSCGIISTRFLIAALLFLANFSMLFGAPLRQFGALWSLAVEEHFYLIWPTCVRHLRERTLVGILAAVIIGEPILRLLAIHLLNHIDIHYKTPFVLDYIAYGALLSIIVRQGRVHAGNAKYVGGAILAVSSALIAFVLYQEAFHFSRTVEALEDLPFTWAGCGVLLLGLHRDHTLFLKTGRTKSRGLLPFYGYISYGLYLVNVFVFAGLGTRLIRHIGPERVDNFALWSAQALTCIGVATGIAFLSRRYFEGPILALKNKWQTGAADSTGSVQLKVEGRADTAGRA